MLYRWHPLFGREIRVVRRVGRGWYELVHIEGIGCMSREFPAWMLDAAYCAAVTEGSPQVTVSALQELHDVLCGLGLASRPQEALASPSKEEPAHEANRSRGVEAVGPVPSGTRSAAPSRRPDSRRDRRTPPTVDRSRQPDRN